MKEKLRQYVESFFDVCETNQNIIDLKQEILTNSYDKFDDLVSSGMTESEAYTKTVVDLGNIYQVINCISNESPTPQIPKQPDQEIPKEDNKKEDEKELHSYTPKDRKKRADMLAIAIALYITCVIPIIVLSPFNNIYTDNLGICLMFAMIAVATVILISRSNITAQRSHKDQYNKDENKKSTASKKKRSPACKTICSTLTVICFALYFSISFISGKWYITWLIFPIFGCIDGIIETIFEIKDGE